MNSFEKHALYSVLLRLTDDGQILTPLERRDLINQIVRTACGVTADDILSSTQNNRKLQIKRGTKSQNDEYTGLSGEITYDSDAKTLRVHDGISPGGTVLARADEIVSVAPMPNNADYIIDTQIACAENDYTWYRKYVSGWIEQGGINKMIAYTGTMITLPVQMRDTNYSVIATGAGEGYGNNINTSIKHQHADNTTTTFTLGSAYSSGVTANWYVCGFCSE